MRPFALRQRRLILRPTSAAGSKLLTYIFEMILKSPPGPFGHALPPPLRLFVAVRGAFYVRNPLPSPISELLVCPQESAPLRDLSIPMARSTQPDFKRRSLPLRVARFSFAPHCARNNFSFTQRSGSSFRIRYFPPGSLSFEPLGTIYIMHRDVFWVKNKNVSFHWFHQIIITL
jgi:hypothetical protein